MAEPIDAAYAATQSHELIPDNYALLTTSEARGKNASAASMVHRAPCTPRPVQRYVERLRTGWVAEWFKAPVLKTGDVQASVGSNPTPSASHPRSSVGPVIERRCACG